MNPKAENYPNSVKMAFPKGTAYHADSDADDEYERSVMASPTLLHTDSEASTTDSEPPSAEHTPTIFGSAADGNIPKTIITEWTAEECAQFVATLELPQYCDIFLGRHDHERSAAIADSATYQRTKSLERP